MRLRSVEMKNSPPVKLFAVDQLADVIVIAGPNGVGKTRLVQALLNAFRDPWSRRSTVRLVVEATCDEERKAWGKEELDTSIEESARLLSKTIQRQRRRSHWESSVIQFESDRANPNYQPYTFTWQALDPWMEFISWDHSFSGLRSRHQDTLTSIFRKVHSLNDAIAAKGRELIQAGGGHLNPADFPDPIAPFKEAFRQLLAPKELLDPDPRDQTLYYTYEGQRLSWNTLSSGEREVVNIVFDFLLRDPADSIIIFDEPELHLHPELSYKLLHTLRNSGARNQFIFVTHSPDIITASLEHSVVFISPPKTDDSNQAIVVREDDASNEALQLIGQSIGIVSLGKRIVLVEGSHTSLDKQTYGAILKNRYPNLVLVPSGGKGLIQSFHSIVKDVLSQSLWGVEFFMLCDRDALPPSKEATEAEAKADGRLKVLKRYHLENYFLEPPVLSRLFVGWVEPDSWLLKPDSIEAKLKAIAAETIPYATALTVSARFREKFGNLDLMVGNTHGKSVGELTSNILDRHSTERSRFTTSTERSALEADIRNTFALFERSLQDESWKTLIPGKPILDRFAALAGIPAARLKLRYLVEAERVTPSPFQDLFDIFGSFSAR